MNNLDKKYLDLVQDIIDNGVKKETRNGGTLSVFGRQIRHSMKDGFPLLTTKKMHWKSIATELIWFLRGDTNIKYLVDNDVHIWDGDAYQGYLKRFGKGLEPATKERFIEMIKNGEESRVDANGWRIGELGPIYGAQWRKWIRGVDYDVDYENGINDEIDQIANLINELKSNPDSRRLMVTAWNPSDLDSVVLPPCHHGFQVYTRELSLEEKEFQLEKTNCINDIENDRIIYAHEWEKYIQEQYEGIKSTQGIQIPTRAISLMWSQRSCDFPLGIPFNIASYGLLLEIIAKSVNMVPDELIGNLGDCHIYNNQIEGIKEQFLREPFPLPTLSINTEFWPTESGECGVGPIDAIALFNSFDDDNFCKCLLEDDIQLVNYQSHPAIKLPLSN